MTIEQRIAEAEKKFTEFQTQRENLLKQAEECMVEMTKLQGEWRVLDVLRNEKKPNKKATVIEAVAEEA